MALWKLNSGIQRFVGPIYFFELTREKRKFNFLLGLKLESLILAQNKRWRRA